MSSEKVREVPKEKIPEQIKEQIRPRKDGQSSFDKVLEQNRLLQQSPKQTQMTTSKSEPTETRVARHEDQGEKGKDRQSDEKEQERGKEKAREERKPGADIEQRVAGKGQKKGSSGEGGGQGRGRGSGGAVFKKAEIRMKKGELTRAAELAKEGSQFATELKSRMKTAHLSREFIQNIVNQVVKFVKAGLNKDGDHEVRLDLHERIFRGLRLRVALKHGKVSVHFNTSNAEVRELFEKSSESIQKELESKGILVQDIKVS